MDAFEAYKMFIALKSHFTRDGYDFFKYNGKTNASKSSFETRKDKYMFHKLSKKKDPTNFVVANFVEYGTNEWIGDMVSESKYEQTYLDWKKKQESLSYVFSQDLQRLLPDLDDAIKVTGGQHPKLIRMFLQGRVNIETLIILNKACNMFAYWNHKLDDDFIWHDIYKKCMKYAPFISFDTAKMNKIIVNTFEVANTA